MMAMPREAGVAAPALTTFGQTARCGTAARDPLCDAYHRLFIGSFVQTSCPGCRPYVSMVNWDLGPAAQR